MAQTLQDLAAKLPTTTVPGAALLAASVYREAVDIACELEQIGEIYGSDCVASVKRALLESANTDWRSVVTNAVRAWEIQRANYDPAAA